MSRTVPFDAHGGRDTSIWDLALLGGLGYAIYRYPKIRTASASDAASASPLPGDSVIVTLGNMAKQGMKEVVNMAEQMFSEDKEVAEIIRPMEDLTLNDDGFSPSDDIVALEPNADPLDGHNPFDESEDGPSEPESAWQDAKVFVLGQSIPLRFQEDGGDVVIVEIRGQRVTAPTVQDAASEFVKSIQWNNMAVRDPVWRAAIPIHWFAGSASGRADREVVFYRRPRATRFWPLDTYLCPDGVVDSTIATFEAVAVRWKERGSVVLSEDERVVLLNEYDQSGRSAALPDYRLGL